MPTRKTPVLQQMIAALGDLVTSKPEGLAKLEEHPKDSLILISGDVHDVSRRAEKLRLAITEEERGTVLDYIAQHTGRHRDDRSRRRRDQLALR